MKTFRALSAIVAILAVAGCQTPPYPGTSSQIYADHADIPARTFTILVSGSDGLNFIGTIDADGKKKEVSGAVPAQYQITSRDLVCSFKKTEPDGTISLAVTEEDGARGSSSTHKRFGGVRAEFIRTGSRQHSLFTTF